MTNLRAWYRQSLALQQGIHLIHSGSPMLTLAGAASPSDCFTCACYPRCRLEHFALPVSLTCDHQEFYPNQISNPTERYCSVSKFQSEWFCQHSILYYTLQLILPSQDNRVYKKGAYKIHWQVSKALKWRNSYWIMHIHTCISPIRLYAKFWDTAEIQQTCKFSVLAERRKLLQHTMWRVFHSWKYNFPPFLHNAAKEIKTRGEK